MGPSFASHTQSIPPSFSPVRTVLSLSSTSYLLKNTLHALANRAGGSDAAASSRLMFSSLAEETRKSAVAAANTVGKKLSDYNNKGKRRPLDGNREPSPRNASDTSKQRLGGRGRTNKRGQDDDRRSRRQNEPRNPFALDEALSSAENSSTRPFSGPSSTMPFNSSGDGLAKRIQQRLRADGISPPQWPAEPGAVGSQHEMSKFRELYETYRHKARASLTKAGLIDDPEKRKRLSDAIEFKGICEEMCPEYEKITRITEHDVNKPEKDRDTGVVRVRKMVKKLARSAAGQEAPLPMDVRSAASLRQTLDYLVDIVLRRDNNLASVHPFLWDRTRAIRRDFAFFSSLSEEEVKTQVYVLENITRFHVTSLHLLSRGEKKDDKFVEQQELEQLGKTLLSLRDVYDDCNEQGITCENEAEFRAYYLLFHGRDSGILETLQRQWRPSMWQDSDEIRTAVSLVESLQSTQEFIGSRKDGHAGPLLASSGAHLAYFRIVEDVQVSYTMACFAECHFQHIRRSLLATVKRALARPKDPVQDVTAASLNDFLRFDTVEQAIEFAKMHSLDFVLDRQHPTDVARQLLVLNDRSPLPHVRLEHQFSQSLVERKRGTASLPNVIHTTIFEGINDKRTVNNGVGGHASADSWLDDGPAEGEQPSETAAAEAEKTAPADASKARKSCPTNNGFVDSDSEDEVPATAAASQPGNPFTSGRVPFITRGKLPSLEDLRAQEQGHFVRHRPQPRHVSTTTNPSQLAKPNPFATPLQMPAESSADKPAGFPAAKPNPFAPAPTPSDTSAPAKVNPFAAPVPSASGSTPFADAAAKSSSPFGSASQVGLQAAEKPDFDSSRTKPNPFSFFSKPDAGVAAAPAAGPSVSPSSSKPAEMSVPAASSQPSFAFGVPPLQTSSVQNASPFFAPANQQNQISFTMASAATSLATPPTVASHQQGSGAERDESALMKTGGLMSSPIAAGFPSSDQPEAVVPYEAVPPQPQEPTTEAPSTAAGNVSEVPAPAEEPVRPERDLLGDFNKWYVEGDNGLLSDFLVESVRQITQNAFETFQREEKERKAREEEERIEAEVERFRVYNIRLKFFYRWKRNARKKRLAAVARKGRDEMRAYIQERLMAQRNKRQADAEAAEREEQQRKKTSDQFIQLVKTKRAEKWEAREKLLASGVLSGLGDERKAAKRIVADDSQSSNGSPSTKLRPAAATARSTNFGPRGLSRSSASMSTAAQLPMPPPPKKDGPKTAEQRSTKPERFRRSLPSMSSMPGDSPDAQKRPEPTKRFSNVSPYWTLKGMGIVPLPDGTAVPDTLAPEMSRRFQHRGWSPRPGSRSAAWYTARRLEMTEEFNAQLKRGAETRARFEREAEERAAANKRKRRSEGEGDSALSDSSVKRKRSSSLDGAEEGESMREVRESIMGAAAQIRANFQAIRAELEEGTEWFRAQNERMRSES
ncbi:hypothetical protein XA68_13608 [Ophiocordyceps unilateralis]|uniref:SAC3/GANP/THP3 conserved domain-containing protein n=1 Tax=Ophiocordyceps unilateralis TaxID=268505 RepID=A0A2A9PC76_OPHUN|nr:hypothetical protein XA68_13608 [Ophiocordyceps unilateralis]